MPRRTVTFTADEVAAAARLSGYTVTAVLHRGDLEDGFVQVAPRYHIQVSEGYVSVVHELPDGDCEFSPPFDGDDQVKDALHYLTARLAE